MGGESARRRGRTRLRFMGIPFLIGLSAVPCLARAPGAGSACDPGAPEARVVRSVADGIITADNARDLERVIGYYAADAILMPPGEEPVIGREAIRPRYEGLFSRFEPHIEARIDEICIEGGLALVRGRNGGALIPRQAGEARKLDDVYLMALRRDAGTDGWHITHLIWHPAGSSAPGKPE